MITFPRVAVLVLNWNGRDLTTECVDSVLKSNYDDFRVMIIDNGSSDGSLQFFRLRYGDRVDYIANPRNLGYSGGFNVGLDKAFNRDRVDYCLVMNNDTVIDPAAIGELVAVAQTGADIGFVTGKVYFHDRPDTLQTVGKNEDPVRWNGDHIGYGENDRGQYDKTAERVFIDDIFTLVSRRLYLDTGGYNTLFFLQSEEYDWQARAKEKGYRIIYTPKAKLWHKVSMTLGKSSARKAFFDARNPMIVILLHRPPAFFRRYFWHHLTRDILLSSMVQIKQLKLSSAVKTWLGFFSGIGWGFRNRQLRLCHFIPAGDRACR